MTAAQRARKADFKNRDRFISLGITIAVLRKLRGMFREQPAKKAGISRPHLSAVEAPSMVRAFSLEVLYNHASAPEIAPGELLSAAASPLYKK